MDDVTFTNSIGTITFKRFMLQVDDAWDWDGRRVKHTKQIAVDGFISQDEAEDLSAILTPSTTESGDMGTLVLPWTTLNNIKLTELSHPDSDLIDYLRVTATFVDEYPEGQTYSIHWFGIEMHNPRIGFPVPSKVSNDEYTQMPIQKEFFNQFAIGGGVLRTKMGAGLMEFSLTGSVVIPPTGFPSEMVNDLVQRSCVGINVQSSIYVPGGYPRPFTMADACPELANKLPLVHIIVTGGRVAWDVEAGIASVNLNLLTQPQLISSN